MLFYETGLYIMIIVIVLIFKFVDFLKFILETLTVKQQKITERYHKKKKLKKASD